MGGLAEYTYDGQRNVTIGSKAAASSVVGKGVDVATDTALDMLQTVASYSHNLI